MLSEESGCGLLGMPAKTPFFQAFGALLFGRRSRSLVEKVRRIDSLGEFYEVFGEIASGALARQE